MRVLTVRMDDELYEKLRWISFKERCSQNAYVVELLKEALKNVKVPKEVKDE
jgi:hypothetical protein